MPTITLARDSRDNAMSAARQSRGPRAEPQQPERDFDLLLGDDRSGPQDGWQGGGGSGAGTGCSGEGAGAGWTSGGSGDSATGMGGQDCGMGSDGMQPGAGSDGQAPRLGPEDPESRISEDSSVESQDRRTRSKDRESDGGESRAPQQEAGQAAGMHPPTSPLAARGPGRVVGTKKPLAVLSKGVVRGLPAGAKLQSLMVGKGRDGNASVRMELSIAGMGNTALMVEEGARPGSVRIVVASPAAESEAAAFAGDLLKGLAAQGVTVESVETEDGAQLASGGGRQGHPGESDENQKSQDRALPGLDPEAQGTQSSPLHWDAVSGLRSAAPSSTREVGFFG